MPLSQSYEVTVVGGGLGGLTAALALRHKGLRVTVLEQAAELGEVGAGIQTAPNASRVLMRLGLRKQLEAIRTEPQDQVRRRWQDGSIIGLTPLGRRVQEEFNAPYWHYHRADLHRTILDACTDPLGPGPTVEIVTGARVVELDRTSPDRPVAVTDEGVRHEADVLVGADGIHSRVRDLIGADDTLVFSGDMAFRTLIPGELLQADPATRFLFDRYQSTIWYGPGRHLVHYLIRGGEWLNIVGCVPWKDEYGDKATFSGTTEMLVDAYAEWDDRAPAMLAKAKGDITCFPLYHRRRDPNWVDGRVALLGDACHAMLPYQAQGASQAMEDGAVLAEELGAVTREGIAGALQRYVNRRARHAGMVQQASLRNQVFYRFPDGPDQQARDTQLGERYDGESDVSYDWLWRGTPLDTSDDESFAYRHHH